MTNIATRVTSEHQNPQNSKSVFPIDETWFINLYLSNLGLALLLRPTFLCVQNFCSFLSYALPPPNLSRKYFTTNWFLFNKNKVTFALQAWYIR